MKRKDFQELAAIRLKEARILLENKCWDGAYYLGGYVVEYALKACISRQTQRYEFPNKKRATDAHTHKLPELIKLAGLEDALKTRERGEPEFSANWTLVRD